MQIGMIGLGRMGANMARRLMKGGHECVVYDRNAETVDELAKEGATGAHSLEEVAKKLSAPRAVWIMLPSGAPTEETVVALSKLLAAGDAIISFNWDTVAETVFTTLLGRELVQAPHPSAHDATEVRDELSSATRLTFFRLFSRLTSTTLRTADRDPTQTSGTITKSGMR
jgi:hypothetical protein